MYSVGNKVSFMLATVMKCKKSKSLRNNLLVNDLSTIRNVKKEKYI